MDHFGATQFAGGGFMTNVEDNTNVNKFQQDAMSGAAAETLRSLTVAQMLQAQNAAQGDLLMTDGRPIKNVTIVGVLQYRNIMETCAVVGVFDGTGTIECKLWLEERRDAQLNALEVGRYVRVYGNFKGAQADRPNELGQMVAYSVRAIQDHNEVVHHNLSVMFEHMYLTQSQNVAPNAGMVPNMMGAPGGAAGGGGMAAMAGALQQNNNMAAGGNMMGPGGGGAGAAVQGGNVDAACRERVKKVLTMVGGSGDCRIKAIGRLMPGEFTDAQIRETVMNMLQDGLLYTTADDETVKVIE